MRPEKAILPKQPTLFGSTTALASNYLHDAQNGLKVSEKVHVAYMHLAVGYNCCEERKTIIRNHGTYLKIPCMALHCGLLRLLKVAKSVSVLPLYVFIVTF